MTSEQAMRVSLLAALTAMLSGGCEMFDRYKPIDPLVAPYSTRRVWAVAPLTNESGSLQADGVRTADQLSRQLANAGNLDVMPLNRVLLAMDALKLTAIRTPAEAIKLMGTLGVDGLLVGSISAYDPYDPPKLGLVIDLYTSAKLEARDAIDARRLTYAGTENPPNSTDQPRPIKQPVTSVTFVLDAADPTTREQIQRYGQDRSADEKDKRSWRRYRISMDLFTEFASYVACWRLMQAEKQRITPAATEPARPGA